MNGYRDITGPRAEPVSTTEAKLHLRITDTSEDTRIASLITAARQWCESFLNKRLISQTVRWDMDAFPSGDCFRLPFPPTASVTGITYLDSDGTRQTLSTSVYNVNLTGDLAEVCLAYLQSWPTFREDSSSIQTTYVTGYATPFTADATTDVFTTLGRTYATGDIVRLVNSGGALPASLSAATDYYVIGASGSTFQLSLTSGGGAIDISTAGTGTNFFGEVPEPIRQAILILVSTWFEFREANVSGVTVTPVPFTVEALLWPYRSLETYGGD